MPRNKRANSGWTPYYCEEDVFDKIARTQEHTREEKRKKQNLLAFLNIADLLGLLEERKDHRDYVQKLYLNAVVGRKHVYIKELEIARDLVRDVEKAILRRRLLENRE